MTGPLAGASTNPAGPAIPAGLIGPTCPIDPAAISVNSAAASRRKAPRAAPVAAGRPGPSPLQKGRRELRPGAGSTTTRSAPISRTRQLVVPRVMMSPTAVSLTISSSSSPTRRRPEPVSPSGRTTGKAPRSGMVPEAVTAERWAPGRAIRVPARRSHVRRGAKSARSAEAKPPVSSSRTESKAARDSPR